MLDQLVNIVRNFGKRSVVDNPEVPNEYNEAVMADATKTIASGFQNVMAGGGFGNILDLFRRRGNTASRGGLLNNPIVSMMTGYFISKLVGKYRMKPAAASRVANDLIPNSVNELVDRTNDPKNEKATMDRLVNSLTGEGEKDKVDIGEKQGFSLQDLLDKLTGNKNEEDGQDGKFRLQDLFSNLARKAQDNFKDQQENRKPGIMDMIKGLMPG